MFYSTEKIYMRTAQFFDFYAPAFEIWSRSLNSILPSLRETKKEKKKYAFNLRPLNDSILFSLANVKRIFNLVAFFRSLNFIWCNKICSFFRSFFGNGVPFDILEEQKCYWFGCSVRGKCQQMHSSNREQKKRNRNEHKRCWLSVAWMRINETIEII